MIDSLTIFLQFYYTSLILSLLCFYWISFTRTLLFPYGKTLDKTSFHWLRDLLLVPKSWFSHFYLLSSCICLFLLLQGFNLFHTNWTSWPVCTMCFLGHSVKRWYECLKISQTTPSSQMHLCHYLVGLSFYTFTPIVMMLSDLKFEMNSSTLFGVLLFAWASVEQFKAHSYLASLRTRQKYSKDFKKYPLPTQGYFAHVACPHYFFELLIYVGLLVIGQSVLHCLVLLWVFTDLHLAAKQQYNWYLLNYKQVNAKYWKSWVPFLV